MTTPDAKGAYDADPTLNRITGRPMQVDLRGFADLKDGWNGRGSVPPTEAAKQTAHRVAFVPTGDGGIQIELHARAFDIEISIQPDGRVDDVWVGRSS